MSERSPELRGGLKLLPKDLLITTGPVDHADWSYRGLLGTIQRQRFRLVNRLFGTMHFHRLLEIGYGSGVFAPELAGRCDHYCGVDVHPKSEDVALVLRRVGLHADLRHGSTSALPWANETFDCVVGVSVLEFVDDLDAAYAEIRRVLRPGGVLVIVTPGHSPVLDLGLKILTGASARRDFGHRRERVIPSLIGSFRVVRQIDYPLPSKLGLYVYRGLMVRKES